MKMAQPADVAMVGMAVMGENLALNLERHGYTVAVYDIRPGVVERFLRGRGKGRQFVGASSLPDLVKKLSRPRKLMMMIRAGSPVDQVTEALLPLLEPGDVLIDGGNSHFEDTARRAELAAAHGVLFVGAGVSGGEEGALHGPSLMPGGAPEAWPLIGPLFQAICARAPDGTPCCHWMGSGGAGHFVKMVHNGIEYGDMELICEAYHLMRDLLGMSAPEMGEVFSRWNRGPLSSYLIEITGQILRFQDEDGLPLLDKILDAAGQKGTGKWTGIAALNEGAPLTLITEAVFARCLSAKKEERLEAARYLTGPTPAFSGDRALFLTQLEQALYASKLVSYAQGFSLLREAAGHYGWDLNYGEIALTWRGGCIIRSAFLERIRDAYARMPRLSNLMLDEYFCGELQRAQEGWRQVCSAALTAGIPLSAMTAALSYYDGYRCPRLPANLLQAQRDYFGAHTYERTDAPRGEFFHTDWTGQGGKTASSTYSI